MSDRASAVQRKVLVLGSLNLDIVVRCARRPEPGETVLGDEVRRGAGGKGANQAAASAAAGARTSLLGRVGDDPEGRLLRSSSSARTSAWSGCSTPMTRPREPP